ncbi:MAG: DUF305 domain-containing protein [Candidatus Promineofilum sp.]|nr:DUF305 domain-containing protein [Promineifilum sp.]
MDSALPTPTHDADPSADDFAPPVRAWWPLLLVALAALLLGGLAGYRLGQAATPAADSVDVGFARDMSVHHEQAVQMAALAYDRSDDPVVRLLAFDILTTQQGQIGIMSGWLDAWGVPWTTTGPRMAWMGMPTEGLMPGMATTAQLDALRDADGAAADVLFLQLMIPHHVGGVDMAREAAAQAERASVRQLAAAMAEAQTSEIAYMNELLVAKGTAPVAAPTDSGHSHTMP